MALNRLKRSKVTVAPPQSPQAPPTPSVSNRPGLRMSVWVKTLLAIVSAGLFPLILISYSVLASYSTASEKATEAAVLLLDDKSLQALQIQADQAAQSVGQFLADRVDDTFSVTLLPHTPDAYLAFSRMHMRDIRYPTGTTTAPQEGRKRLPLYHEIAFIDASGREQVRIVDGAVMPPQQLRDVSIPANTTYKTENYFADTRALLAGEIYVSPVMAWHTSSGQQPAQPVGSSDAPQGSAYANYQAVMRFGTPLYTNQGVFAGMVLLSLDYRHMMEYLIHIQPVAQNAWTLYADYGSGNYAFMFDQDGYTIAHPLLSRIRGLDDTGQLVSPMAQDMTPTQTAQHPFNLRFAAWADPNWPTIFAAVARNEHGAAVTVNRAGTQKASAYAPIPFTHGVYRASGLFGGIVVGANVADFHRSATSIRDTITTERANQRSSMLWIALVGIALLVATALLISRGITRPLHRLARAAQAMEQDELDSESLNLVINRRIEDEMTKLAQVFKRMAEQVHLRQHRLKEQIRDLRIEIDEGKKQQHVVEITETTYFQELQQRAEALRKKRATNTPSDDTQNSSKSSHSQEESQ